MTDPKVLAVYVRYVSNFIDDIDSLIVGLNEDFDIEGYKKTLSEVVRKLEAEALQSEAKECPVCCSTKALDFVSMYSGQQICSDCRQHEEACDFLGILPEVPM